MKRVAICVLFSRLCRSELARASSSARPFVFRVHRDEFLIHAVQLFAAGLQLFASAAEFLVAGSELFGRRFVLLDRVPQVGLGERELALELLRHGGGLHGAAPGGQLGAFQPPRIVLRKQHQQMPRRQFAGG